MEESRRLLRDRSKAFRLSALSDDLKMKIRLQFKTSGTFSLTVHKEINLNVPTTIG